MGSWYNTIGMENPCITTCGTKPIEPQRTDFVPAGTAPTPSKMTAFVGALATYRARKVAWDKCNETCLRALSINNVSSHAPRRTDGGSSHAPRRTDGGSSHDTAELVPLQQGKADSVGSSTGLSTGAKIGIGVGIVALVAVFYFMRKGKK